MPTADTAQTGIRIPKGIPFIFFIYLSEVKAVVHWHSHSLLEIQKSERKQKKKKRERRKELIPLFVW